MSPALRDWSFSLTTLFFSALLWIPGAGELVQNLAQSLSPAFLLLAAWSIGAVFAEPLVLLRARAWKKKPGGDGMTNGLVFHALFGFMGVGFVAVMGVAAFEFHPVPLVPAVFAAAWLGCLSGQEIWQDALPPDRSQKWRAYLERNYNPRTILFLILWPGMLLTLGGWLVQAPLPWNWGANWENRSLTVSLLLLGATIPLGAVARFTGGLFPRQWSRARFWDGVEGALGAAGFFALDALTRRGFPATNPAAHLVLQSLFWIFPSRLMIITLNPLPLRSKLLGWVSMAGYVAWVFWGQ